MARRRLGRDHKCPIAGDKLGVSYLLDTGILVHAIRGSQAFDAINNQLGLTTGGFLPIISIISQGEILSLAQQFSWGAKKVGALTQLLHDVVILPIDRDTTAEKYAELDAFNRKQNEALGVNDLWIATTAIDFRLTLLTFDGDFDRSSTQLRYIRYDVDTGAEVKRR